MIEIGILVICAAVAIFVGWKVWTYERAPKTSLSIEEALRLAIRALNNTPSFDTGIPDTGKEGRSMNSYRLIPKLEAALKQNTKSRRK